MTFGKKAVVALTGVSHRQVDHWATTGIVRPSIKTGAGKGSRREYSFKDLVQLKVTKHLRDGGISLQKIRKALIHLRRNFPNIKEPLAQLRFLTNGEDLFVLTDDPQVALNALQRQFVFSLALGEIIEGLQGALKKLASPKKEEMLVVEGKPLMVVLTTCLDDGGFTVICKEMPDVISRGETEQEALDNIRDALEVALAAKEVQTRRVQG